MEDNEIPMPGDEQTDRDNPFHARSNHDKAMMEAALVAANLSGPVEIDGTPATPLSEGAAHTPGPWRVVKFPLGATEKHGGWFIEGRTQIAWTVNSGFAKKEEAEERANAELIAAAPAVAAERESLREQLAKLAQENKRLVDNILPTFEKLAEPYRVENDALKKENEELNELARLVYQSNTLIEAKEYARNFATKE